MIFMPKEITAFKKVETFFNSDEKQNGPVLRRDIYHPTKRLAFTAKLVQHQHASNEVNMKYDRIRIDFDSEDERDRFYKSAVKKIFTPDSHITRLAGKMKNVLVIDAIPTKKFHESILRALEHGPRYW